LSFGGAVLLLEESAGCCGANLLALVSQLIASGKESLLEQETCNLPEKYKGLLN